VKSRKTTDYEFSVTDANGCNSPPKVLTVTIIEPAPAINTLTTVVIGASVQINAAAPNGSFSYVWTPQVFGLSDTLIANPIANSTNNITYSVLVQDEPLHCFVTQSTYSVIILPYTTIDIPAAFTPNGDGINDLIFPDGWGIRQLRFFRVYNRWGQLLFETTEYRKGWDGSYQGVPQNMESYLYQAEVETYLTSEPLLYKTGTFKLIR
jgi:gliding motility-associated-like protein